MHATKSYGSIYISLIAKYVDSFPTLAILLSTNRLNKSFELFKYLIQLEWHPPCLDEWFTMTFSKFYSSDNLFKQLLYENELQRTR
jgi:hypothetical protein